MADDLTAQLARIPDLETVTPGSEGYDAARSMHNAAVDNHPLVVVRPSSAEQVAAVVAAARSAGVPVGVVSGRHGAGGSGMVDGGVVVDTARLNSVEVDVAAGTAWAGGGATAGTYTAAAGAHGLATGFGDTATVGIAGITLGGGAGFLGRRYGLAIDQLLAVEVVTADGEVVTADRDHHPDLFWALRGGGGNFGVVTRLQFALHPVPAVTGGLLAWEATPETVAEVVAAAQRAPDELTIIAAVMVAPPAPFIPAELHGRLTLLAFACHCGDLDDAQQVYAELRSIGNLLADGVVVGSYADLLGDDGPPPSPSTVRTGFASTVTPEMASTIVGAVQAGPAPMSVVQIRVLGGAISRQPADSTAYAHRGEQVMLVAAAMDPDPHRVAEHGPWVEDVISRLRGENRAAYVNFLDAEGPERVRDAYPGAAWQRLREVKRRYDPDNIFVGNQNIPPAPPAT